MRFLISLITDILQCLLGVVKPSGSPGGFLVAVPPLPRPQSLQCAVNSRGWRTWRSWAQTAHDALIVRQAAGGDLFVEPIAVAVGEVVMAIFSLFDSGDAAGPVSKVLGCSG